MQIVAIYGWQEITAELTADLAGILQLSPFETGQRLQGQGPAVLATFAAAEPAERLVGQLNLAGFRTLVIDTHRPDFVDDIYVAKSFRFGRMVLRIETVEGPTADVPYAQMHLLLATTQICAALTESTTETKISLKRTLLAGGIPRSKEVTTQTTLQDEQRQELLYLQAGRKTAFIFRQHETSFTGHGADLQITSERNMALFKQRLKERSPQLRCDGSLLTRAGQVRLLGPRLAPEKHFSLALELLRRSLLPKP